MSLAAVGATEQLQFFDFGKDIDVFRFGVRSGSGVVIDEDTARKLKHGRRVKFSGSGNVMDFGGKTAKGDGTFAMTIVVEADSLNIVKIEDAD